MHPVSSILDCSLVLPYDCGYDVVRTGATNLLKNEILNKACQGSKKLVGQVYLLEELVSRRARYYELIDAEYLCFHGNTVDSILTPSATVQR